MKVSFKNVKPALNSVVKKYNGFINDKQSMERASRNIRINNLDHFREGFSVENRRFKALSPMTIKNREHLAKSNKTHKDYRANRSNVTLTGQLVKSLRVDFMKNGVFKYYFSGNHKGYLYEYKRGKRKGKRKRMKSTSNRVISKSLNDMGFKLFGVAEIKSSKLMSKLKKDFFKYIKRQG